MTAWIDEAGRFARQVREVTQAAGVPLILDEVVSGFRLAPGGAQEYFGIPAEMACYGKISSGLGIPLSIVGGKSELMSYADTAGLFADNRAGKVWISSTHKWNFVAVVAALAALRKVRTDFDALGKNIDSLHARICQAVRDCAARLGTSVEVLGHSRLQSVISFGHPSPEPHTYRSIMGSASPWHLRPLLALGLYLRLGGVYVQGAPTMNLSFAHGSTEADTVAAVVETSLMRMKEDGMLPETS
jgi:glutamate-1-semialdehyde 2,1-aminomutase